jgi:hypothetical protein
VFWPGQHFVIRNLFGILTSTLMSRGQISKSSPTVDWMLHFTGLLSKFRDFFQIPSTRDLKQQARISLDISSRHKPALGILRDLLYVLHTIGGSSETPTLVYRIRPPTCLQCYTTERSSVSPAPLIFRHSSTEVLPTSPTRPGG